MAKQSKYKRVEALDVKWPSSKKVKAIVKELSSKKIMGSFVMPPNAPQADKIKYDLCSKIVAYRRIHDLSQKALAEKIGVDEPEMSRILHYKIERYSIERLIEFLIILYPKAKFELKAA